MLLAINALQQRALTGVLMEQPVLDSVDRVSMYLRHRFHAQLNARFIGLFTDVQHRLLAVEDFGSGALQRVAVYPREIVRSALKHNAAGVVFAHNHPSGRAEPSALDKTLTKKLGEAMRCIEVSLLDHLIVTPEQIWSFRAHGLCRGTNDAPIAGDKDLDPGAKVGAAFLKMVQLSSKWRGCPQHRRAGALKMRRLQGKLLNQSNQ
jgi:DNA repair protein RadC